MPLLEIKKLKTVFHTEGDIFPAVDDISFTIDEGRTLAIIGESGSGKSVTALSIMGLIEEPGKISGGEIRFNGANLLGMNEKALRRIRGNEIAMIYQDPLTTLNPMIKVGKQIEEVLRIHKKMSGRDAYGKVLNLMEIVGIPEPEVRYHHLPERFSGGMRQRLMIAMALACEPKLLIADEPTTALDVTIQAEILDLLRDLKKKYGMAMILNTHDLGVVAEMADDVVVMYCGKIMEYTSNKRLFENPVNPYTKGLLECIPRIDDKKRRLDTINGYVPHLSTLPNGCKFSDRCKFAFDKCKNYVPDLLEVSKGHYSRCWLNAING